MTPASQEEMLDQSVKCSAPQLAEQPNFVTHLCEVLEDDLRLLTLWQIMCGKLHYHGIPEINSMLPSVPAIGES